MVTRAGGLLRGRDGEETLKPSGAPIVASRVRRRNNWARGGSPGHSGRAPNVKTAPSHSDGRSPLKYLP
jgi:hypothetical protein